MNKKTIKIILTFTSCVVLLMIVVLFLPIITDPLNKYDKAWKNKDKAFYFEQISIIENETDVNKVLNILCLITESTNFYIISPDEFNYEISNIDNLEIYKSNIVFGLSVLFSSDVLFSDNIRYLSEFRKYDKYFSTDEKKKIIDLVEKPDSVYSYTQISETE